MSEQTPGSTAIMSNDLGLASRLKEVTIFWTDTDTAVLRRAVCCMGYPERIGFGCLIPRKVGEGLTVCQENWHV
jgi:hypothetical protein